MSPAMEAWSPNYGTAKEFSTSFLKKNNKYILLLKSEIPSSKLNITCTLNARFFILSKKFLKPPAWLKWKTKAKNTKHWQWYKSCSTLNVVMENVLHLCTTEWIYVTNLIEQKKPDIEVDTTWFHYTKLNNVKN